jgi:hypothetical protein
LTSFFSKTLKREQEVRSFDIDQRGAGWESSEHTNQGMARIQSHSDWHRVERELARFTRQIAELRDEGWRDA